MTRKILICFFLVLLLPASAQSSRSWYVGNWDGDDWGAVWINDDATGGTYQSTFNGEKGRLRLNEVKSSGGTLIMMGTFYETSATKGHPVRKGGIKLTIPGAARDTIKVEWWSTDKNAKRSKSGTSTWKRKS